MEQIIDTIRQVNPPITDTLKRYTNAETYLERFCCAPPEPYYAMGAENFLKNSIEEVECLKSHPIFSELEISQIDSVLERYKSFLDVYQRATSIQPIK